MPTDYDPFRGHDETPSRPRKKAAKKATRPRKATSTRKTAKKAAAPRKAAKAAKKQAGTPAARKQAVAKARESQQARAAGKK